MFENPRRGRQARYFTTNAPKILDLKSSSEQIFSRKLPLGAQEETTVYSSSLFSTDLDSNGPVRVRFCGRHVYELFVFEHILENSRVYFPLLFTDCLQWSRIPMILGSVFLDDAVIRHDRTNLRNQCVSLQHGNGVSCPVSMRSKLQRSVARDKSYR